MNIILWIIQILLMLLFLFTGSAKFLMPADEMAKDMPPYLSLGFLHFIGVCEILGGIGMVVPWMTGIKPGLTPLAAGGLLVIMIGATFITAIDNVAMAIVPATAGVLCAIVVIGRRSGKANNADTGRLR